MVFRNGILRYVKEVSAPVTASVSVLYRFISDQLESSFA